MVLCIADWGQEICKLGPTLRTKIIIIHDNDISEYKVHIIESEIFLQAGKGVIQKLR